jgi:hypothetical protein
MFEGRLEGQFLKVSFTSRNMTDTCMIYMYETVHVGPSKYSYRYGRSEVTILSTKPPRKSPIGTLI